MIALILWLSRSMTDPVPADPTRPFDVPGTILSAAGLVLVVTGVLAADNDLVLTAVLVVAGALLLGLFWLHIRSRERRGGRRCSRPRSSGTACRTSAWSRRTCSGCS